MKNFFISYTHTDESWAEWISYVLEEENFNVIIQAWDFRPGSNFVLEMQRAASEAERTIMVLSPDYLKSQFASPEWASAFVDDPQGLSRKLVPVQVRDCEPRGLLKSIVQIRISGVAEDAARRLLIEGINLKRAKPLSRPAFPGKTDRVQHKPFPGVASSNISLNDLLSSLDESIKEYKPYNHTQDLMFKVKEFFLDKDQNQPILRDASIIMENIDAYNKLPRFRGSGYKADSWLKESGFSTSVARLINFNNKQSG